MRISRTAAALAGWLLACVAAAPAVADTVINAKVHCQTEYRDADLDAACERGVDLAARHPDDLALVTTECGRNSDDARSAACRRGVSLHARMSSDGRGGRASNFSYSWQQGHGGAQVGIGNYDLRVGDAERSMEECMRAFEGSSTPPSCLSGLTVQPKAPGAPPHTGPR